MGQAWSAKGGPDTAAAGVGKLPVPAIRGSARRREGLPSPRPPAPSSPWSEPVSSRWPSFTQSLSDFISFIHEATE